MQNFSKRLKEARKAKGLTQTELAEKLGITQKSYQRMETGNHDLKMSTIRNICQVLEISTDWLLNTNNEGDSMNANEKAMNVLSYIESIKFSSYDEFIEIITREGKLKWVQEDMGHQIAYMIVCGILGTKPDEKVILALEETEK